MHQFFNKPLPGAQLDCAHPLARGLVGCWLMNEGGWRCHDLSPYKNHGALVGFGSPPRRSSLGLQFDGVDDYVQVPYAASLDNFSEMTVETWIYPTAGGDGNFRNFVEKNWAGVGGFVVYINDVNLNLYFVIRDSVSQKGSNFLLPSLNNLYHVVGTFKKNTTNGIKIYVNSSVALGANTLDENLVVNSVVKISNSTTDFKGTIGSVLIWNRALPAQEVKERFYNPYDMFLQ